jgi:predicted phosphodiesterase
LLLNPGSVSLPKGGHPKTYAVLEEDEFTICTLDRKPYLNIRF